MKILVVDDEMLITLALKRALEKRGHIVHIASGGVEGLRLWKELKPELVVIDFIMPDMNADQVLVKVGDRGQCKVVLMSAYLGERTVEKPSSLQIDLFIKKPFDNIFEVCGLIENAAGL